MLPADESSPSHLRIHAVSVPVNNLDTSIEFYETTLRFNVVRRVVTPLGIRVAFVAPPDGAALLVLSEADTARRSGTSTDIVFVTDDIERQHREWVARGVVFHALPQATDWGARHATFSDPDGNAFQLFQADAITRQIEVERQRVADANERARRVAQEIRIAKQVQAGLFPRVRPVLRTLDYAGLCLQARQVGGDYFDFLDFGEGRLGVVIGDVSGKGIGAALLMATLQAHVRSHYSQHPDDLPALLRSVNRLFQESAPSASYASLFFGVYDDRSQQLTYVNCGHPPVLVLRSDGRADWLDATSYVIGMFEQWTGESRTIDLAPGDMFVLYTDGVTEAVDQNGTEFGALEMESVCRRATNNATAVLDTLVEAVRTFSGERQSDDITVVTARVTA